MDVEGAVSQVVGSIFRRMGTPEVPSGISSSACGDVEALESSSSSVSGSVGVSEGGSSRLSSTSQSSVPQGADLYRSSRRPSPSSGKMSSGVGASKLGLNDFQNSDKLFWMSRDEEGAGYFSHVDVQGRVAVA